MSDEASKGPIQLLCEEVDFAFRSRLETPEVLVAFVRVLVSEIQDMRRTQVFLAEKVGSGVSPSLASYFVLEAALVMLDQPTIESLIASAAGVHDLCGEHNPEDAYPTDHLIDMVSLCASAIRFGLELPCRSRHAAAAAEHIWSIRYGVSLFDNMTLRWRRDWTRAKLADAIVSLLPTSTMRVRS